MNAQDGNDNVCLLHFCKVLKAKSPKQFPPHQIHCPKKALVWSLTKDGPVRRPAGSHSKGEQH